MTACDYSFGFEHLILAVVSCELLCVVDCSISWTVHKANDRVHVWHSDMRLVCCDERVVNQYFHESANLHDIIKLSYRWQDVTAVHVHYCAIRYFSRSNVLAIVLILDGKCGCAVLAKTADWRHGVVLLQEQSDLCRKQNGVRAELCFAPWISVNKFHMYAFVAVQVPSLDNVDQRIADDTRLMTQGFSSFVFGTNIASGVALVSSVWANIANCCEHPPFLHCTSIISLS